MLQLSPCAVKDYNRGRDYLCDLASREGVPLFESIEEAISCVVGVLTEVSTSLQAAHGLGHGVPHVASQMSHMSMSHHHKSSGSFKK